MREITIAQDNRLTSARYELSLIEKRVFYYIIKTVRTNYIGGTVQRDLFNDMLLDINIPDLTKVVKHGVGADVAKIENKDKKEVRTALIALRKRSFEWNNGLPFEHEDYEDLEVGFIDWSKIKKKGVVQIQISKELMPFLVELSSQFTPYSLNVAMSLKSKWSQRMYELCQKWQGTDGFRMSIADLRKSFVLEDAYKEYGSLKKFVLDVAKKELKSLFKIENNLANESLLNFVTYLNESVVILRVEVPKETDLNHYFEIMNNRGEQLEKHEVLKSQLISYLENIDDLEEKESAKILFSTIWDGCSQMERYIQYAFDKNYRSFIFGNTWNEFLIKDFDDLMKKIKIDKTLNSETDTSLNIKNDVSILSIVRDAKYANIVVDNTGETPERFNSVINFQNFLLHCLLVLREDNNFKLDDKKLISNFDFLKKQRIEEQIQFVKDYIFCVLKMKFLLDNYAIKREFINNSESWSLKKLHFYNDKSQSYIGTFGTDENEGREVEEVLQSKGWKLKGILCTHCHSDHTGANAYLQDKYGCPVFAYGMEAVFINNSIRNYTQKQLISYKIIVF